MTLDLEQVKETFCRFSGEVLQPEDRRAALCIQLCGESAARAEALAREDCENPADFLPALESWAAAEAFYQLALTDEALTPESVTAGGVQVKQGERSRRAKMLAEEKRRAASPALREEAFYFGRV